MVRSADWALGQPAGGFPSCTDELMEPICHAGEPLAPPNAERMLESSDEETPGTLRGISGNSEWDAFWREEWEFLFFSPTSPHLSHKNVILHTADITAKRLRWLGACH